MSCFGGEEERIYSIEVLINKLTLTAGKMKDINDLGDDRLVVKVKVLDFPVFEITREDFCNLTPPPPEEDGGLRFLIGKNCMFVKRPKDLVRDLKSMPVKVGVFRIGDTYPVAEADIPIPGCLCDQVAMSSNDTKNLPKPFTIEGGFHLVDPGENPAGTLDMELKLTCFGKSIMTHYERREEYFVFRNADKEREFCVKRLIPLEFRKAELLEEAAEAERRAAEARAAELRRKKKKGKKGKKGKKKGKKKK